MAESCDYLREMERQFGGVSLAALSTFHAAVREALAAADEVIPVDEQGRSFVLTMPGKHAFLPPKDSDFTHIEIVNNSSIPLSFIVRAFDTDTAVAETYRIKDLQPGGSIEFEKPSSWNLFGILLWGAAVAYTVYVVVKGIKAASKGKPKPKPRKIPTPLPGPRGPEIRAAKPPMWEAAPPAPSPPLGGEEWPFGEVPPHSGGTGGQGWPGIPSPISQSTSRVRAWSGSPPEPPPRGK